MSSPKYVNLLKDKRCVVLGGTSGIGLAVAEALIEEGARVHIGSSSQDKVDATIKQLSDSSKQYNADRKRISGTAVNLKGEKMEDSIRQFFKAIPKEWNGKVDHIIHTAGDSLQPNPIDQVSYESIISAGQVRFVSCVLTAKVGMEFWDKGGSYIVTSGSVSIKPIENWAVPNGYATALEGLTRGLALDLANKDDRHIRVNCVLPGPVKTPLWSGMPDDAREGMMNHMAQQALTKSVPGPEVIAQVYLGILKDSNATGKSYFSESGLSLV